VASPRDVAVLGLRVLALSARETGRNFVGLLLLVAVPVVFIGAVQLTAGEVLTAIQLFYPDDTLRVTLTARQVCLVFGNLAICGFLAAYFALTLFHFAFGYFRFWVIAGLPPVAFLAGRFGFFVLTVLALGLGTTFATSRLLLVENPGTVLAGFLLLGVIYGCFGGIVGLLTRDPLVGFLAIAILADVDAAWLQNPVYYSSGQNLAFVRWLPAYHPGQLVLAGAFAPDLNTRALAGSLAWAGGLLALLLAVCTLRLGRSGRPGTAAPTTVPTPRGAP
jgi:hypothetical protein